MAETMTVPHHYHPSVMHMGDCSVCGNVQDHPNHAMPNPAKDLAAKVWGVTFSQPGRRALSEGGEQ